MYTMVGGSQLICTKKKSQHLKIWKRRRRLQPELLNGILSRVQLRGNDANSCEHREAPVVDLTFLSMAAMPWDLWIQLTKENFLKVPTVLKRTPILELLGKTFKTRTRVKFNKIVIQGPSRF